MKQELTDKIIKNNPVLFRGPSGATYLSVGDGWFEIIGQLSKDISLEISKMAHARDLPCAFCQCPKGAHGHDRCLSIYKVPTRSILNSGPLSKWEQTWRENYPLYNEFANLKYKAIDLLNRGREKLYYEYRACGCQGYDPQLPVAVQVKEKFGGLRFYVNFSTPRIEELIREAEEKADRTCETCGNPGKRKNTNTNWVLTICPECEAKRNQNYNMAAALASTQTKGEN